MDAPGIGLWTPPVRDCAPLLAFRFFCAGWRIAFQPLSMRVPRIDA